MFEVGPTYCETFLANTPTNFPIEPVNVFTSIILICFGVLAWYTLRTKRYGLSYHTFVPILLLLVAGIGSALWHGLRTELTLALDAIPGALCLLALLYSWSALLINRRVGFVTVTILALLLFGATRVFTFEESNGPHIVLFLIVGAIVAILLFFTFKREGKALGFLGLATTISAALAAIFRTIDIEVCALFPFGTHFLWHIFIGIAAFIGIVFIAELRKKRLNLET